MEELAKNVMEMIGALNATISQMKAMEVKIRLLEEKTRPSVLPERAGVKRIM